MCSTPRAVRVSKTPSLCGVNGGDLSRDGWIYKVLESTTAKYPDCPDILQERGVSLQELTLGMQLVSLFLGHNTAKVQNGGHYVSFTCRDFPAFRNRLVTKVSATVREIIPPPAPEERCPFCLLFSKKGDKYYFERNNDRNTVEITCNGCKWPSICCKKEFIKFFLSNVAGINFNLTCVRDAGFWPRVRAAFTLYGIKCTPTLKSRVITDLMGVTEEQILRSDQRIESFMKYLNQHNQFGVLLYSNGDLVVPGARNGQLLKSYQPVDVSGVFMQDAPRTEDHYWDALPDKIPSDDKKAVFLTFEAIADAVYAYQFSIPVICLDACFTKTPGKRTVLLAATFQTTDGHLMPMCYGTAPSESDASWGFFLVNLREALMRFCEPLEWNRIVFMSDRHPSIAKGIKAHFPDSHHLFCVVHIHRNLACHRPDNTAFWDAVEAETAEVFAEAVMKLPDCDLRQTLVAARSHWSRWAIRAANCRRYGNRTSNWAECVNNALRGGRFGTILSVLLNAIHYTYQKLDQSASSARIYDRTMDKNSATPFAGDIFASNARFSRNVTVQLRVSEDFIVVYEQKRLYEVTISPRDKLDCSCHRFFDEGIPCPHMIAAFQAMPNLPACTTLIDPIYSVATFIDAFTKSPYGPAYPLTEEGYEINPNVIIEAIPRKRGAPPFLRFESPGDPKRGHVAKPRRAREGVVIALNRSLASQKRIEDEVLQEVSDAFDFLEQNVDKPHPASPPPAPAAAAAAAGNVDTTSPPLAPAAAAAPDTANPPPLLSDVQAESDTSDDSSSEDSDGAPLPLELPFDGTDSDDSVHMIEPGVTSPIVIDDSSDDGSSIQRREEESVVEELPEVAEEVSAGVEQRKSISVVPPASLPMSRVKCRGRNWTVPRERTEEPPPKQWKGVCLTHRDLLEHDSSNFGDWIGLYCVTVTANPPVRFLNKENQPPTSVKRAQIFVSPSTTAISGWPHLILAHDVIEAFLGYVHAFTAVGLEAEAFAYSAAGSTTIDRLLLPPLEGTTQETTGTREVRNPYNNPAEYDLRCWLRSVPGANADTGAPISPRDILKMYTLAQRSRFSFSIVLSPKAYRGSWCYYLTDEGFQTVADFQSLYNPDNATQSREEFVASCIEASDRTFLLPASFDVSLLSKCEVTDLRRPEDIFEELYRRVTGPNAEKWHRIPKQDREQTQSKRSAQRKQRPTKK